MSGAQKPANKRSAARLAAVQALYQMDLSGSDVDDTLAAFEIGVLHRGAEGERLIAPDFAFLAELVRGVVREQAQIDPALDRVLKQGWPLTRIDTILRQILRAAMYELKAKPDVPAKVVIVEYMMVAEAFFTAPDVIRMVNAVLDQLARLYRTDELLPLPSA